MTKKALINPYRVISVHFCHISTTERAPAAFESYYTILLTCAMRYSLRL